MKILNTYTDGSFNTETEKVGASSVLVMNDATFYITEQIDDTTLITGRQIAGELIGAIHAIDFAIANHFDKIVINHDYEGVSHWANHQWKANREYTNMYIQAIDNRRDYIDIEFQKVDAHTGDYYNEQADKVAKYACGVLTTLPDEINQSNIVKL